MSRENEYKKKLFLDDLRSVDMVYDKTTVNDYSIVRSYSEFVAYIQAHGLPDFISFDNDLGLDQQDEVALDGYAAAKWLVYESGLDLSTLRLRCIRLTLWQQSRYEDC